MFIYLALASSGGTIPLEALPSPLRLVANFEPLRQVLDGVRSILFCASVRGDVQGTGADGVEGESAASSI